VERGVVLVTGGSRGIGAAVARAAAAAGWAVCLTYRDDEDAAAAVVAAIQGAGGVAGAVRADVSAEADVLSAFAAADGMGQLTALVANAGVTGPGTRVDELTAERVERILRVNALGAILCCREAVRRLSHRHGGPGGSIVLMGSAASRLGGAGEFVDYAASKGAVDAFGLGLAREVAGEGIRVNVVRPGLIDTTMNDVVDPGRAARLAPTTPIGRVGAPEEVAAAVVWLLGEEATSPAGASSGPAGPRTARGSCRPQPPGRASRRPRRPGRRRAWQRRSCRSGRTLS
jgi:NAD(P)-dependent dehydrogenase (short-subunit alcohol dehydrogenase family)